MKNTLILDLETGGLNADFNAVCSCSVCLSNGEELKTWFIKPYTAIYDQDALNVNGLSMEELKTKGVALDVFILELIEYCRINFGEENLGGIYLLGHNINFDIKFLKKILGRQYKDIFHYHYKDSMILALSLKDARILPSALRVNLVSLNEYFFGNSNNFKAHTSQDDVIMTLDCYSRMLELIKENKK